MNAAIHVAGWTLVHFAWQGALVALAAALALRLLRHATPQSRYVVGCLALAAMLVLPGATAWRLVSAPAQGDPMAPVRRAVFLRVTPEAPEARHDRFIVGIRRTAGAAVTVKAEGVAGPMVLPTIVTMWLAGVCLLLARLAGGWWRVHRLYHAAATMPPSRWQPVTGRLARQLGLRRLVHVVDASFVDGPVVIGWLQPVILLPVAALAGLTPEQVRAILAHELAHVRRHDAFVNVAQTLAETLLFYHPAVWWVSSRIRTEREHCCDDVALAVSGDAYAYAAALAELESWRAAQPAVLAMAATDGPLLHRVARLLAPPARAPRAGITLTMALVLLFVVGAGALRLLGAGQPAAPPAAQPATAAVWRMVFDHPSGQMSIRGFTARDLVRYAYQLPHSHIIGGPAWLDSDSFDLVTTVDHVPAADETPGIVRQLLEERFGLRVHETTIDVPALALQIARPDGALGPNLQPATAECFDQRAWVAAGAPNLGPLQQGQRTVFCGAWDGGVGYDRVVGITMDDFAAQLRHRVAPAMRLEAQIDVVNQTGLEGPWDASLEYFKPAAFAMSLSPALAPALRLAGFESVPEVLESQLGLKLVPAQTAVPAIAIDEIQRPLHVPPTNQFAVPGV
ncbi:MAG TPA: M56 family metallopeptidase [Vicinamibacterales bacterium]|nr:M56 family metallopeptidase [Vicinamibacterales bacterium]